MRARTNKTVNEVFLDAKGVIRSVYHGLQTAERLQKTNEQIMRIMDKLIAEDRPVRLLADIRDVVGYDQPARLEEMRARTRLPFWKMAIVTGSETTAGERISRILTAMSGRRGEIRYFRREDDAIGWMSFMRPRTPHSSP